MSSEADAVETEGAVGRPAYPSLSQPTSQHQDGLSYSRHYAQKIRDLGKSSKESWIKRLWNHMFGATAQGEEVDLVHGGMSENVIDNKEKRSGGGGGDKQRKIKSTPATLPPIHHTNGPTQRTKPQSYAPESKRQRDSGRAPDSGRPDSVRSVTMSGRENGSHSAPVAPRHNSRSGGTPTSTKLHLIPVELANSPYMPSKEKHNYKIVPKTRPSPYANPKERSSRETNKQDVFMKKPSHPYLSTQPEAAWRPKLTRDQNVILLEKKAKSLAEGAMKGGKIFACDGPYPVDAYVRFGLRKRGWVEKFGHKANNARGSSSGRLQCEEDEDFEAIIEQEIPAPWNEENGLYAMTSRLVRHYPAKFIWGGTRGINSMIVRSEVVTNHFPKARFFSSKVLIVTSLKELLWVNNADHYSFFPRCHLLSEDAKEDTLEDFRLTAAMGLLKCVVQRYLQPKTRRSRPLQIRRENTKYEEVMCSKDSEETGRDNAPIFAMPGDDNMRTKCDSDHACNGMDTDAAGDGVTDGNHGDIRLQEEGYIDEAGAICESGDKEDEFQLRGDADVDVVDAAAADDDGDLDGEADICATPVNDIYTSDTKVEFIPGKQERVMPDLKSTKRQKVSGEVPVHAVELAVQACKYFLHGKSHNDIDTKMRGLTGTQWDKLMNCCSEVANGASVPITEGLLNQADDVLKQMRKVWPQYDIDGTRNIWIIKPGDKSKAIGIEFCDKVEDILRFINNPLTAGTYVMQKYIERPLLIFNCKFDIRQWFLVTDWSPLTIWFYKDSYLRICSQEYSYDSMHESVHLSNVAVQQNYLNGKRDERLPENNFMTSEEFIQYLDEIGAEGKWEEIIYKGMKDAIINTLTATQDVTESKKNAFELYGADFMIAEDYKPYLLEVNASPGMAPTSLNKAKLCAAVIDDALKVVLDKRDDKSAKTGRFELIFRDANLPSSKIVDTKLLLEGQKIRRGDLHKYNLIDQKMKKEGDMMQSEDSPQAQQQQQQQQLEGHVSQNDSETQGEENEASGPSDPAIHSALTDSEAEETEAGDSQNNTAPSDSLSKQSAGAGGKDSSRKPTIPPKSGKEKTKSEHKVKGLEKIYASQEKKDKKPSKK